MICGDDDVDIESLRQHTHYAVRASLRLEQPLLTAVLFAPIPTHYCAYAGRVSGGPPRHLMAVGGAA